MQQKKQSAGGEKKTILPGLDDAAGTRWLTERKCPECGKSFCVPDMEAWAYKSKEKALCSWHCLRALEKRLDEKAVRRTKSMAGRVRLTKDQIRQIVDLVENGKNMSEIARAFGVSRELVGYHVQKARKKG